MLCTFEISGPQAKIKLKQPNIFVLASQRFLRQLRLSCRSEFKIKIARFGFLVSRHGTLEVKGFAQKSLFIGENGNAFIELVPS